MPAHSFDKQTLGSQEGTGNTMKKIVLLLLLVTVVGRVGWAKTVGLWKDRRSYITDGMLATLHEAGWRTVILERQDLSEGTKLADLDVVFLPGGWNAYYFANFTARRNLVRFVAGGKGILAGAFRSGYVRTANRPLLPQVGATHNRVNGPWISAFGDSDLARAIDQPFCPGGWDHLVVKVGPLGKAFAVNGSDPVGVYGEVHGGRYLIFGAFIGMDAKAEPMQGTPRRALLKMIDWLAAAPKLSDADRAKHRAQADLDFLRRERLWDWTLNERGPDLGIGVIPSVHNRLATSLESRQYMLRYMSQFLSGKLGKQCRSEAKALGKAVAKLRRNYERELAEVTGSTAKMGLDELLAGNPAVKTEDVLRRIEETVGRTEEEKQKIVAVVKRCASGRPPVYAARQVAMHLHGNSIREALFLEAALTKVVADADQAISGFRPAVRAAKAEAAAQERAQDLATIPEFVRRCDSTDVAARREAVLELGRIGDPGSASTLIRMLKDPDEKVRTDAVIGLGWMQSRDAVPALIELARGADTRVKSRAIQALGQIGDSRAAETVLAHLDDQHPFLAENAILSAGWLKARAAVPALLKIISTLDPKVGEQRLLMIAALRSLGQIGDPAALPRLEEIVAKTDDFPRTRRAGRGPIANIYATPQGLGLKRHAELALAQIKAGGRPEPGVRQPEFLSSKDSFHALDRSFNALAGRPLNILMPPTFAEDGVSLLPYLVEAGLTGVHNAWGSQDTDPDLYFRMVEAAGELGLRWIDVLPINAFPYRQPYYTNNAQMSVEKAGADLVLSKFRDAPAFAGFWSEETYPAIKATATEFETWLKKKHGPDYRARLGLAKDAALPSSVTEFRGVLDAGGPLKTECLEFGADRVLDYWRETQDWLRGRRKGCVFTFSVSGQHFATYAGLSGPAGDAITANGPESYQSFGRDNAFLMEMHKDGEARPVMSEFYNWYTPTRAHEVRGFAQHLMHGECFYNFAFQHIFKHAQSSSHNWTWDASRWSSVCAVFQKARRIKEYLAVPTSGANVAQLCSESTACHFNEISPLGGRWYQNQAALWTALQQSQIPADVIWAETLSPAKLARYRVLVMSDAKMLSDAQAGLVRDWVSQGGVLVASGSSSLLDRVPAVRKNYLLADVFGVDYVGFAGVTDPARNDTMCFILREPPALVESSMALPAARHHVHRGLKPVKSIGAYTVSTAARSSLPGIEPGTACEYDMPLGYDQVKLGSAEVLAAFPNGDAALTLNSFGKGRCYFWAPIYPGLCHVASEWEMQPNRKDFWPNVRELLSAMVKGGLAHQGASLPVEVNGVSKEVEVTVRQQPEHSRWMIHLLDYDPNSSGVKSAALTVHPPTGRTVKRMFYPDTDTKLKFRASGDRVTARLRDFEVHDMLVVEWGQ